MDNFFNSKKYIILLIVVCLLFTIITVKVFDYMPKPVNNMEYNEYKTNFNNDNDDSMLNQTKESYANNNDDDEEEIDEDVDENDEDEYDDDDTTDNVQNRSGHVDFMPQSSNQNTIDFIEIPAPKGSDEEKIKAYDTTSFSDNN